MTPGSWFNSLRVQIVLLLTLALLPLGAVAIYQTNRVGAEADRNAELALLAVTGRAAKAEELIIERAFGVARFFSVVAQDFIDNPERCTRDLTRFLAGNNTYSFIGILPSSGLMTCSSANEAYDFSDWPEFDEIVAAQRRTITVNESAPLSGESVFVVSEPFFVDDGFAGFISISIPHKGLPDMTEALTDLGLEELITFNASGEILTARLQRENAQDELPVGVSLADLAAGQTDAFQGRNQMGERRTYTVVPIGGSPATVIGIWRVDEGLGSRLTSYVGPAVFPILMWFASMAVAMLSIYMLVTRHLVRLRINMEDFAETRSIESRRTVPMPNEIEALARNFDLMTDDIMRDEAELEDILREKNVLIKEVHHRVKNNLQLISSIMNMQIRTAEQDETKTVLARLQDRVLSLATIHRDLYESQNGGLVDVGALVREIVEKSVEVAVSAEFPLTLETDIDRVWLYPDQAVPLSLMVAEGMTNAMKYLGVPEGRQPWIYATLKKDETECVLTLANSCGVTAEAESTGLGAQLINAFSIQLGGQVEVEEAPESYAMSLRFKIADFVPEDRDF